MSVLTPSWVDSWVLIWSSETKFGMESFQSINSIESRETGWGHQGVSIERVVQGLEPLGTLLHHRGEQDPANVTMEWPVNKWKFTSRVTWKAYKENVSTGREWFTESNGADQWGKKRSEKWRLDLAAWSYWVILTASVQWWVGAWMKWV